MNKEKLIAKLKIAAPFSLYYIDYRDSFDENLDEINDILANGYVDGGVTERWDYSEVISQILEEIFDAEELDFINSNPDFSQEITDFIYENDESNPEKDLIRNTGERLFMVDLDYHFSDPDYVNKDDREFEVKEFLKKIGAEISEKNINKVVSLRSNAPYGGTAYAMLYTDLSDFYEEQKQNIILDNIILAIINTANGSGRYMDDGDSISCNVIISRKKIFDDYSIHYGLQEIFGDTPKLCSSYKFIDK